MLDDRFPKSALKFTGTRIHRFSKSLENKQLSTRNLEPMALITSGFEELSRRMAAAMTRRGRTADDGATATGRLRAVGRAYVELALERPELFRLMFSPSGLSCLDGGASQIHGPTPAALLGGVLDDLVAEGHMSTEWRTGAELRAWAAVHGFASLVLVLLFSSAAYAQTPTRTFAGVVQRSDTLAPIPNAAVVASGQAAVTDKDGKAFKDFQFYIKQDGVRDKVKVLIGGAPITQDFANEIGADGFAPDASSATRKAKQLLGVA